MNILQEAYTALLAGLTSYKPNTKEIQWENKQGDPITVEIIDAEKEKYILRGYCKNGNKRWENEYQNGLLHGKSIYWRENGSIAWKYEFQNGEQHGKGAGWWKNGRKHWEDEFQNGQQHGKHTEWYENGNKHWEAEYYEGLLHGKCIEWRKNGNKHMEEEFQNDELIKRIKINRSRIMSIWDKIKSLVYQDGEE